MAGRKVRPEQPDQTIPNDNNFIDVISMWVASSRRSSAKIAVASIIIGA